MNAVLRIFSGLHRGAEIELAAGTYVLGTDDSCDIILCDSTLAARHAAFHVTLAESGAELSVEGLDGPVMLDGHAVEESEALPPRRPIQLGMLLLAWAPSTDIPDAWAETESLLTVGAMPQENSPAPSGLAATEASAPAADSLPASMDRSESPSPETMPVPSEEVPPSTPRRRYGRIIGLGAVLLLTSSLCITWQDDEEKRSPAEAMRTLLDEAGYQKLSVIEGKDSITISGRIASDRERGRLMRLAQLMDSPVYLDVTVGSDAADALRASFNTMGLYPEVTELPLSSRPALKIKAYIKNGIVEEQALRTAVRNIPALRPQADGTTAMEIFRDIRHENDVRIHLDPALAAAGLFDVRTEYLDGRIVLSGPFTPQMRHDLERVMREVKEALGIPLCYDVLTNAQIEKEKEERTSVYAREKEKAKPAPSPASPASGSDASFKITSVSMGVMRFVTLASGERVFEGGELPGGYVLEHIDVDALTLRKNNVETLYPLRGPNE